MNHSFPAEQEALTIEALTVQVAALQSEKAELMRRMAELEERAAEDALRKSEEKYRMLFETIDEGFCVIEVIFDSEGEPHDYRFLETNPAFDEQTGMRGAAGRTMKELAPLHEPHWFQIYGEIAVTGEPRRFEQPAEALGRYFDVYAFRVGAPEQRRVAILFKDIAKRLQAEQTLKTALEESERAQAAAEAAGRAKDHFLAVLSHELRTPLTPVSMITKELLRDPGLPAGLREDLEVVDRNVEVECRLIDDLLDLSRIMHGKFEVQQASLDLHEVIRDAAGMVKGDVEGKTQILLLELLAERSRLLADRVRLQQVVWNLLKNATKFTPHQGTITIRTFREGEAIVTEVEDTGIGMEPETLERVFGAFSQGSEDITRRFGGLGLGLAISNATLSAHGASLRASSPGLNRGSKFSFRLPLTD